VAPHCILFGKEDNQRLKPRFGKGITMTQQPTPYQYVKLGSNLEFLRGISSVSLMQTTSLAAFPNLMGNLPAGRYSVPNVVNVLKSLLVQLEELGLVQSLRASEPFRAMLKGMEEYLARQPKPELTHLTDQFADELIVLSRHVGTAVRSELGMALPLPDGAPGQAIT